MTLGIGLLYVGCVLFMNGVLRVSKVDAKSCAVMNFFTGGLLAVINAINIANIVFAGGLTAAGVDYTSFYGMATNMLFGFTYLFVGMTNWFGLDGRPLSWYCFFVACNTVPIFLMTFAAGDLVWGIIWVIWGLLWLAFWVNGVLGKLSEMFMGSFTWIAGVVTCWIPGLLMVLGWWPFA